MITSASFFSEKLAEVNNYLEYIQIKEELEATNEILDDKKLLKSIQAGLKQYENNQLVDFDEIKDV